MEPNHDKSPPQNMPPMKCFKTIPFELLDDDGTIKTKPFCDNKFNSSTNKNTGSIPFDDAVIHDSSTTSIKKIDQFFNPFLKRTVIFQSFNGYGLSTKNMTEDYNKGIIKTLLSPIINTEPHQQPCNKLSHSDEFRIRRVRAGVYQFESQTFPGRYIGIDKGTKITCMKTMGFKATLVTGADDARSHHRVVSPARNGAAIESGFVSLESVTNSRFLLNHANGWMWYFDRPANREELFREDSTWRFISVPTAEERREACASIVDALEGKLIIFEGGNGYGLSSVHTGTFPLHDRHYPRCDGEQLCNDRKHRDRFIVHRVQEGVYKFESVCRRGHFVGVIGSESGDAGNEDVRSFKVVMVSKTENGELFRVVPPWNECDGFLSFESVSQEGFYLSNSGGLVWLFKRLAANGCVKEDAALAFAAGASWRLKCD
mmetsp:Transcript_52223/g.62898  ORF Transcript_52223/g.62898 Transcript_52223/m.62898 type:complete len:430 (+) Transcript_52223:56-1345(+)